MKLVSKARSARGLSSSLGGANRGRSGQKRKSEGVREASRENTRDLMAKT